MALEQDTTQRFGPAEPFVGLYTMVYRPLGVNYLTTKNFRHSGNLRSARERAEKHLNIIGGKLNFVQPLISDLSIEEAHHLGHTREAGLTREAAAQVEPLAELKGK